MEGLENLSKKPTATQKFEEIFNGWFKEELKRDGSEDYAGYRAIKLTFVSPNFFEAKFSNKELRALTKHLMTKPKYSDHFRGWIENHELNWSAGDFKGNSRRIYVLGKEAMP